MAAPPTDSTPTAPSGAAPGPSPRRYDLRVVFKNDMPVGAFLLRSTRFTLDGVALPALALDATQGAAHVVWEGTVENREHTVAVELLYSGDAPGLAGYKFVEKGSHAIDWTPSSSLEVTVWAFAADAREIERRPKLQFDERPLGASSSSGAAASIRGWSVTGAVDAYEAARDSADKHGGESSALLRARRPGTRGYATLMQSLPAAPYRGKRVRVTAWARSQGADAQRLFWVNTYGPNATPQTQPLTGGVQRVLDEPSFRAYELTVDVPDGADRIDIGVGVGGAGAVWLDDVALEGASLETPIVNPGLEP